MPHKDLLYIFLRKGTTCCKENSKRVLDIPSTCSFADLCFPILVTLSSMFLGEAPLWVERMYQLIAMKSCRKKEVGVRERRNAEKAEMIDR